MEKRLLFFFAITFVVMWAWFRIFPPASLPPESEGATPPAMASETPDVPAGAATPPEVAGAPEVPKHGAVGDEGGEGGTAGPAEAAEPAEPAEGSAPPATVAGSKEQRLTVDTERLHLVFTNRGARLVSARLVEYEDANDEPYELVAEEACEVAGIYPLDVRLESPSQTEKLQKALFAVTGPTATELAGGESTEIVFAWADGSGLSVTKRITIDGDSYELGVEVSVRDGDRELSKEILYGAGLGTESVQSRYAGVEKGVVDARGEVSLFPAGDVEEGAGDGVGVGGVGVSSHYFVAVMIPREEGLYGARLETTKVAVTAPDDTHKERQVISAALVAANGPAAFRLFLGPKKLELLETLGPGFASIIEFGNWMRYPALLLRAALMRIYDVIGNYGWSIVLLTVLINVVLMPLKHYSFVSMRKMQKLGPQIQRIKDRYRKVKPTDPRYQQMNQEVMELYKQHNVNPLSGCLPMLLMIPFFFAFYRLLMASIELRHAPFMGWIQDLSVYDPFFVLPILMGLSQVATQRMTPQTTADPVQAKVMSFMPIMFTFILAWAPAGLVLYWFSNNLVSMGQQVMTNRFLAGREEEEAAASKKKRKSKKGANKE